MANPLELTSAQRTRRRGVDSRRTAHVEKRAQEQREHEKSSGHQQKITMYVDKKYESHPGAGHMIKNDKRVKDIRMFLQNPNGVMGKDTRLDDRRALLFITRVGCGYNLVTQDDLQLEQRMATQ